MVGWALADRDHPPSSGEEEASAWRELSSEGYTIKPFLDAAGLEALEKLRVATIPNLPEGHYISVFSTLEIRRAILEGFQAILKDKIKILVPGFRLVFASFVTKKAGTRNGRVPLHLDSALVDYRKDRGINGWVPLCNVDELNGCLRVVGRSHRFNCIGSPFSGNHANFPADLAAPFVTSLRMKAGEACLFDTRLLHASEENRGDSDRVAAFFSLIPEDRPIRLYYRSPETPRQLDVFQVDSEFLLRFDPLQLPNAAQRETMNFLGSFEHTQRQLCAADFAALHADTAVLPEPSVRKDIVSPQENFPAVFADAGFEESFSRNGYVVLPFFGPEDIEKSKKLYFANLSEPQTDFFTTAFLPDGEPRRNVKEGLEAMIAPRIAELMPGYATCVGHFIAKRGHANGGSIGLHQDWSFVDHSVNRAVHVWIALVDVDEHNGCLKVLPGSHVLSQHISAMGPNAAPYAPYCDVLEAHCSIGVPLKAGEALFFDERTLHGSFPNRSPDLRIAAGAVFLPKGVKQRLYVTDAVEPGRLDILEVESETLLDYSSVMRPPYPEGFKKIGTVDYTARPLSPQVVQSLRRVPATVPAALLGARNGFFARLFGRR